MWIGRGNRVAELERTMAEWVGVKYGVCVGSGTAALVLAMSLTPSKTFYYKPCTAIDIALKLAGKERGREASIAVYPEVSADIIDYARRLPVRAETRLTARFGVFSFSALKDVSGGLGGCLVSNYPIEAEDFKRLSPLCDINAAMILSQLKRYDGQKARLVAGGAKWIQPVAWPPQEA